MGATTVDGERVRLRELGWDEIALLEGIDMTSEYDDFGFTLLKRLKEQLAPGAPKAEVARLLVEKYPDHAVIGILSWHWVQYGPNEESRAISIGITLRSEERGKGYGSEAQRLLTNHLFATTVVSRIEASTDTKNIAEQRCLEKIGFVREGVLRAAQWRSGELHDMVVYSRLRTD
ncbi:MAG: hypothetical protein QOC87_1743 [Actinomycetota bacterium]|nr:hypothetical protein [Actinomycetota bacterium]